MANSFISRCSQHNYFAAATAAFIALLFGAGFYLFPLISDDLSYRLPFVSTIDDGYLRLSDICSSLSNLYNYDNIRLANIVMILTILLPKWLTAAASAVMVGYVIVEGLRIAGCTRSKAAAMALASYVVLILPWQDQMYVFDFQLNYLWASAVSLLLLGNVLMSRGRLLPMALLGLVAGMWHEGFSIPLIAGMLTLFILSPAHRNKLNYTCFACLCLGALWLVAAPATFYRLKWTPWFADRMNIVAVVSVPALAFVAVSAAIMLRKRKADTGLAVLAVIALCSTAIMLATKHGPRVGWLGVLTAGIGLVYIMEKYARTALNGRAMLSVSAAAFLLSVWHLSAVDVLCYRLGSETSEILSAYRRDPRQTIFNRMTLRSDAPLVCMQRPYFDWFAHQKTVALFGRYYGGSGPKVVPEQLRGFVPHDEEQLWGEFYICKDYIVGPAESSEPDVVTLSADYGYGSRERLFYRVPFTSEGDGKEYAWYYPDGTSLDQVIGKLKSLSH